MEKRKKKFNIHNEILKLLQRRWLTSTQIQKAIKAREQELYSESTITARIRDLRKPEYGGHPVIKKSVSWSRSPVYVHAHFQDVADQPAKVLTNAEARAI